MRSPHAALTGAWEGYQWDHHTLASQPHTALCRLLDGCKSLWQDMRTYAAGRGDCFPQDTLMAALPLMTQAAAVYHCSQLLATHSRRAAPQLLSRLHACICIDLRQCTCGALGRPGGAHSLHHWQRNLASAFAPASAPCASDLRLSLILLRLGRTCMLGVTCSKLDVQEGPSDQHGIRSQPFACSRAPPGL